MKHLSKKEILEVIRCAGNYQREVFFLYDLQIIEVTKYSDNLVISVHYIPEISYTNSEITYTKLYKLFRRHFRDFRQYIDITDCYSILLKEKERVAHFQIRFYA